MIRVEQMQEGSSGRCTVIFDNGEEFEFSKEELCAFHISPQKTYSENQLAAILDKVTCERAKEKVIRYVTFSKKTGRQVFDKIVNLGFETDIAEQLVQELTEKEYIDDREYCRSYVRQAIGTKAYSINRIKMELRQKGVGEAVIEEVLNEFSADDTNAARTLLNKKLRAGGEKDYNKLYSFLMRKGFSGETVRKVLQETEIESKT